MYSHTFLEDLETCETKVFVCFLSGFHVFVGPLSCRQHGQGSADSPD